MTGTGNLELGQITVSAEGGHYRSNAEKQTQKAVETFSVFMAQNMLPKQETNVSDPKTAAPKAAAKTDFTESSTAYDRLRYKERSINEGTSNPIREKIASSKDELKQFAEDVVREVADELDVPEEKVAEVLAALGLTVFELLEPEKLGMLVSEISDFSDSSQLLLDESFSVLKSELGELADSLMEELDVMPQEFSEILEELTQPQIAEEEVLQSAEPQIVTEDAQQVPEAEQTAVTPEATFSAAEKLPEDTAESVLDPKQTEIRAQETVTVRPDAAQAEKKPEAKEDAAEDMTAAAKLPEEAQELTQYQTSQEDTEEHKQTLSGREHHRTEKAADVREGNTVTFQPNATAEVTPEAVAAAEQRSQLATETLELIRRIAENFKVILSSEQTTMEMQLNPENLGKLYLEITAKEGAVRAQIAAQNEAVKTALEAQLADLRQHLEQAGVKVDAVEVTVASHEFEKNLEQEQHRKEEQERQQEISKASRRNLKMDELDTLSGLMTEEEQLAAQIMKDNGNSVDLTA